MLHSAIMCDTDRQKPMRALTVVALLVGAAACSGDPSTAEAEPWAGDSGMDAAADAAGPGLDAASDTPPGDAATDASYADAHAPDAKVEQDAEEPIDAAIQDVSSPDSAVVDGAAPKDAAPDAKPDAAPDAQPDAAPAGPFKVYVSPTGKDTNDGSTLAKAVLTLTRVQAILQAAKPGRDVEVRIAPGRYQAQKVTWKYTMPTHKITFMPLNDDKNRPIYDGCLVENVTNPGTQCPGGTWFILDHAGGQETNLHFEYIYVERYQTAISLNGDRDQESTSNGSNRVFGCYFKDIGNEFNPALATSTAALRLVNSDDNEIVNNHFVDIVNTTSGALLHAIYAAHMSDRNLIQSNRFERGTGDPVRIRDYSNDNEIRDNRFIKIGAAAYSDWYCDHEVNTACTKPAAECPSWRNQFRDNFLDGSWTCDPLTVWKLYQDDTTAGCTKPSGAARVSTSGNTQQSPPCSS